MAKPSGRDGDPPCAILFIIFSYLRTYSLATKGILPVPRNSVYSFGVMARRDERKKLTTRIGELVHNPKSLKTGCSAGERDPNFVERILRRMKPLFGEGKYFRLSVDGWENVPEAASLFVSNHSGGTIIPDVWGFGYAWHEHFGMERPIHPLAHDMIFAVPKLGKMFGRMGVLRARTERAYHTLTHWKRDVMVMPGGDRDAWRPYRQRYQVKFSGRKGYARLALRAGVPVIPMANAGAHQTLVVLTDGEPIAKLLRLDKAFRASIFPISLSFPWGLSVGPWPHVPMPTHLRYKLGKPIYPPTQYVGCSDIPQDAVDELDAQVQASIQASLDELRAARHAERVEREAIVREKLTAQLAAILAEDEAADEPVDEPVDEEDEENEPEGDDARDEPRRSDATSPPPSSPAE